PGRNWRNWRARSSQPVTSRPGFSSWNRGVRLATIRPTRIRDHREGQKPMFKIQGADQKEYGPISADVLRQWIAERRADGRTLVQAEGTTAWRPLSEFPEFAAALAAGPRTPMPGGPAPLQTPRPAGQGTTSGMAVASMVL